MKILKKANTNHFKVLTDYYTKAELKGLLEDGILSILCFSSDEFASVCESGNYLIVRSWSSGLYSILYRIIALVDSFTVY